MNSETKRLFKNELYQHFERIGKALASRKRLEFIDLLSQRPRSVQDLADETGLSVANASQHLQVLKHARLVMDRREGNLIYYVLRDEEVTKLWNQMRTIGESHIAEIDQILDLYLTDRDQLQETTAEELYQKLDPEETTVIDVRPREEYDHGHIKSALSVPVGELKERLNELPRNSLIVAYCRGPYCVFSDEAVKLLEANGFKAERLAIGFPEWKTAGYPIEIQGSKH